MINQYQRSDIWVANLNPTQGSEQAGIRPVIIFQNDIVSQFTTTIIAIPLRTKTPRFVTNLCSDCPRRGWISFGLVKRSSRFEPLLIENRSGN
ncbi:type II toxin-antitoxin system PemK/MazF family toxin [Moorena sp. SIO3A2]|uniref:type II toxin-antitoxin system PemK/MazF family toxin n=1 Tax=Moorena sp. SIO3A2 TaxID=2607841 RepID=UPI00257C34E4|nr:type II toxin-antitoxin system PemK/MazF family toxin [Moorena sp. SIO3A2]